MSIVINLIYQSANRIGGDANFANFIHDSMDQPKMLISLTDSFRILHLPINLYYAFRAYKFAFFKLPFTCILAEFKGASRLLQKYQSEDLNLIGPRVSHLKLQMKSAITYCIDYLPLSYSNAGKKSPNFLLRCLYQLEAKKFSNLWKNADFDGSIFFSKRDAEYFEKKSGNTARIVNLQKTHSYRMKIIDERKKNRFLFIGNFDSKFNRMALDFLINRLNHFSDEMFDDIILLSGFNSQKIRKKNVQVVDYSNLRNVITAQDFNIIGFCFMPASAGKQNKIFDYVQLDIPFVCDPISYEGLDNPSLSFSQVDAFSSECLTSFIKRLIGKKVHCEVWF